MSDTRLNDIGSKLEATTPVPTTSDLSQRPGVVRPRDTIASDSRLPNPFSSSERRRSVRGLNQKSHYNRRTLNTRFRIVNGREPNVKELILSLLKGIPFFNEPEYFDGRTSKKNINYYCRDLTLTPLDLVSFLL